MNSAYIVFDLDGTLLNTKHDLAYNVNLALQDFGLPAQSLDKITSFLGSGSVDLIKKSAGEFFDLESNPGALKEIHHKFIEYYSENLVIKTQPYPHVVEFLQRDIPAAVLTNKPLALTRGLLQHFGWEKRFDMVLGGDDNATRKPSPLGLQQILAHAQVGPERAVMVGDGLPDILCARNAQVRSVLLLSGFETEANIRAHNPDYIVSDFAEFVKLWNTL